MRKPTMTEQEFNTRMTAMVTETLNGREGIFVVTNSGGQSCSNRLYLVNENTVKYTSATMEHEDYENLRWDFFSYFKSGIHLMHYVNGECVDKRHIRFFNQARLFSGIEYLTIYQEYGLEPVGEKEKAELAESIKAEKIKDTLVWACWTGDKEKIQQYLNDPKLKPAQLNKKLDLCGTPLVILAQDGDFESFKAVAEKGGDVSKKIACTETPLMEAFRSNSYDIVKYIADNYPEQFHKEIKTFIDACLQERSDERFYQLLLDAGVDMGLDINAKPQPIVHVYARVNNAKGLKFVLEHGADPNMLNKDKMTPLQVAEKANSELTIEVLKALQ